MTRKRYWLIIILLIALLVAGCARASPTPAPTSISTAAPGTGGPGFASGGVIASGVVVPAQEARLSFTTTGRIQSVEVVVGDKVEAGDVLVKLDATDAEQAVAQARAQQSLAELSVTQAEVNLSVAGASLKSVASWSPNKNAVAAAESAVANAEAAMEQAQAAYDRVGWMPGASGTPQSLQLEQATNAYNLAQANLDYIQSARPDVAKARAQVDLANVSLEQAKVNLSLAQMGLETAYHALDRTLLRAPFGGSVASVEMTPGEVAMPGQLILVLADLERLRVETTDLSERDISKVSIGQTTQVYVEALSSQVSGKVSEIAPQATALGGDVVYTVTIELDEQPDGLLWGMSVEVEVVIDSD